MNAVLPPSPAPTPALRGNDWFAAFDWASTPLGPIAGWPALLAGMSSTILAAPTPLVIMWGADGLLLYNEAYAAIAGNRHPAILGQPALSAWPEVAAHNRHVLTTCLAGQSLSIRDALFVLCRHGHDEDVWFDVDYSPLYGPDGAVAGVFCIASEVTARNLAARKQAETESQLALAIEGANLATWDFDLKNDVFFWSDKFRAMLGQPPEIPATQANFRAVIHPDDLPQQRAAFEAALDPDRQRRHDTEIRIIRPADGQIHWIAFTGRVFFDEQRQAIRMAGTAQDITARKNAECRQAGLVELGDRLRAAETTADIAFIAAEIAGRALNCPRAGYAMITDDVALVEADWTDGAAVSLVGPRLFTALGERYCTPLRAGRLLVIDDTATHPATSANAVPYLAIHMRAAINVPLLENGMLAAIFYIHDSAIRHWTADEIRLAQDIADRTWEAFCRARSTQRLQNLVETLEQQVAQRTAERERIWRLSTDVMLVADPAGIIASVNPAWTTMLGWPEHDLPGRNLFDLTHQEDWAAMAAAFREADGAKLESRHRHRNGDYLWLSWRVVPDETAIHAIGRDITAEREQAEALQAAEAALRQAQKMEAVGQLTGGIAHDFNNLLQGITGALDLAEQRLAQQRFGDVAKYTEAARASSNRAVALTHRLLAFSRRQPLDPQAVEANPLVASMEELLRRTMGEQIEVTLDLAPDLWPTMCDPHQLESAILNLAINARDAMPDGGRLTIATANTTIDPAYAAARTGLAPGPYICLSVADTGTGMTPSVIEQAFEPFYTTKPLGQGTGLGLSMIYGFIRQSDGDAQIESQLGIGTTMKLFLPRYTGAVAAPESPRSLDVTPDIPRHATILVVEDEEVVRNLVLDVLEDLGLTAIAAATGPAGLEILASKQPIDLLITDIGLPGLNGRQMADAARLTRPDLKILFMTGYAEIATTAKGVLEPGMAMIPKPFAITTLTTRIQEML